MSTDGHPLDLRASSIREVAFPWEPADPDQIFSLLEPDTRHYPFFLNSPHSGDCFPPEFLERANLSKSALRRASDLFVDALFAPIVALGVPLMRAHAPRSFLDLNREPLELDPRLIAGSLPSGANTRSARVAAGLGIVPRLASDGAEIYTGKLALDDVQTRIEAYYMPYHRRLKHELTQIHRAFGDVFLIDCHSMPSNALGRSALVRPHRPLPDIVLGDRFGTSCHPMLIEQVETRLRALGLMVERNQPYAGGFNTEHYGRPALGWHALQIEINRALYMDEQRQEIHSGFAQFSGMLEHVLGETFESCTAGLHFLQRAAE
jgi:N-formylglutamate amidohydrolase